MFLKQIRVILLSMHILHIYNLFITDFIYLLYRLRTMQHTVTTRRQIIIAAPPATKSQKDITVSYELSDSPCTNVSAFQQEQL